jgi:hypothetical protein
VVDFSKKEEIERWLTIRSPDVAIVMAARNALRAVPELVRNLGPKGGLPKAGGLVLDMLRDTAVSWVVAQFPSHTGEIRETLRERIRNAGVYSAAYAVYAATIEMIASAAAYTVADDDFDDNIAADLYAAASADADAIDAGASPQQLAAAPLWPGGEPKWATDHWTRLKIGLRARDKNWTVWTEWYEARRDGRESNEELEVARVMIEEQIWKKGPKAVNAEIKRLIEHHKKVEERAIFDSAFEDRPDQEAPPPSIDVVPSQGPGPRFRATEEGPVDRAPPADLDAQGNDTKTIDQLKPLALRCAADLKTRLPPNQFGELLSAVDLYVAALDPGEGKTIEWGEVWGHGVILQNAATAAERKVDERILPALEDPAKTALESLLTIHGPLILATWDGAKFSETAADFRLTRDQQEALRVATQRVAEQLKADKEVVTPRAAESVAQATESIGQGPHPERGSVYGLATVKNISIVLVGGAAIATPALVGALLGSIAVGALAGAPLSLVAVEAVKKSAAFNALVTQLGAKLDTISDEELRAWLEERSRRYAPFRRFVARNAEPLRKIAETTPELRWMLRYIDFIAEKPEQSLKPP